MWDIKAKIKAKNKQNIVLKNSLSDYFTFFLFYGDTVREGVSWQILPESIWSVQDLTLQTCTVKDPASSQAGGRGYPSQGLFSNPHTPHERAHTHTHTPSHVLNPRRALISTNCCWTVISLACQVFHTLQKLILTSHLTQWTLLNCAFLFSALVIKW